MRTLVTGGTGFTGTALVQRLLKQGHDVIALDYKEGLRTDALRRAGARVIIGSVTDPQTVKEAMQGVDVVHHLAAAFREMNVPKEHYDRVNIHGAQVTLDAAVSAGVRRFIYCSTCGVHGNVDVTPADENSPIQPADYYQRSKYLAEPIMQRYAREGKIETVILRPAAIYGPGDLERFAMIYRQSAKGWFPMFGSGDVNYHPNYVDNLVDAFLLARDADSRSQRPCLSDCRRVVLEHQGSRQARRHCHRRRCEDSALSAAARANGCVGMRADVSPVADRAPHFPPPYRLVPAESRFLNSTRPVRAGIRTPCLD